MSTSRRRPRSQWGTPADFEDQNTRAVRLILCDVDGHGGEESLCVRWSRAFLARQALLVVGRPTQTDLFGEAAA